MSHIEENRIWDTVIVGGGSAGLASAIYTGRARMSTLVLEGLTTGGEAARTDIIENYPGFIEPIHGPELMDRFRAQAEGFGSKIDYAQVVKIENDGAVRVLTLEDGRVLKAYTVILATGTKHKTLDVPGEYEYLNAGVSYCATCDGAFFKDVPIAVVGGGDSAVEEGTFLTRFASKVYIVHRRDSLRAAKIVQERAFANPKIEFVWNAAVTEVVGENKVVTGLKYHDRVTDTEKTLRVDGVFVFIGMDPNTGFVRGYVETNDLGQIITDERMRTNVPGVYAAGDNRTSSYRQVATAVGDAVTAAIDAEKYLEALKHSGAAAH